MFCVQIFVDFSSQSILEQVFISGKGQVLKSNFKNLKLYGTPNTRHPATGQYQYFEKLFFYGIFVKTQNDAFKNHTTTSR